MARRARRGLADLSDSDEENRQEGLVEIQKTSNLEQNTVSLFDTKVFTDNVLSKIQEEENKVSEVSEHSSFQESPEKFTITSPEPERDLPRRRSFKRAKLLELLSSDEEEEKSFEDLIKSSTLTENKNVPERVVVLGSDDEERETTTLDDSLVCTLDDIDEQQDQNDYRVLVKHFGVSESLWIRLNEQDTMQRVFDETCKAVKARVTLMIDVDGEREELVPTQTVKDLRMSIDRCIVVYSYPLTTNSGFKLKVVTAQRRATREIACHPNETFAEIFKRYCEQNGSDRGKLVFKLDGEVLADKETPEDYDLETGQQVEAHLVC